LKSIVVGYDGTDAGDRALGRAADLAQAFEARIVVARLGREAAIAPMLGTADSLLVPTAVGPAPRGAPDELAVGGPEPGDDADRELDRARALLARRKLQADLVRLEGDPAGSLIELADERDADVIVVGNPELGFLGRLLGEDVGGAVARRADRDVLLVP
jgi:nucleotide-binding universal stress UspA family protein